MAGLAALASGAGLLGLAYRDVPAMVEQAQAADLATLFVAGSRCTEHTCQSNRSRRARQELSARMP